MSFSRGASGDGRQWGRRVMKRRGSWGWSLCAVGTTVGGGYGGPLAPIIRDMYMYLHSYTRVERMVLWEWKTWEYWTQMTLVSLKQECAKCCVSYIRTNNNNNNNATATFSLGTSFARGNDRIGLLVWHSKKLRVSWDGSRESRRKPDSDDWNFCFEMLKPPCGDYFFFFFHWPEWEKSWV